MIEADQVTKQFRSGRGMVTALSRVSFSVETGRCLTIVGKSGSGKTTLLNCIGGLEKIDSGDVRCYGIPINRLSASETSRFRRKNVGFVFQTGNLLSYLNVLENVSLPLALNGWKEREKEKRARKLLDRMGLGDAGAAMPNELSGGEMQRAAFARAIAHFPKILLADEPTASLDSETGIHLIRLMTELSRDNGCILIVSTHDREIILLSDNTIHLKDGKIVEG